MKSLEIFNSGKMKWLFLLLVSISVKLSKPSFPTKYCLQINQSSRKLTTFLLKEMLYSKTLKINFSEKKCI